MRESGQRDYAGPTLDAWPCCEDVRHNLAAPHTACYSIRLLQSSAKCEEWYTIYIYRRKGYDVSFKLKAIEGVEKKFKEATALEFYVDPSWMSVIEGCAKCWVGYKPRPGVHAGPRSNAGVRRVYTERNKCLESNLRKNGNCFKLPITDRKFWGEGSNKEIQFEC